MRRLRRPEANPAEALPGPKHSPDPTNPAKGQNNLNVSPSVSFFRVSSDTARGSCKPSKEFKDGWTDAPAYRQTYIGSENSLGFFRSRFPSGSRPTKGDKEECLKQERRKEVKHGGVEKRW